MKKFMIELGEKYKCPIHYETRDGEDLCHIESDPCVGDLDKRPAWCPLKEIFKDQAFAQACALLRTCEDNVDLTEEENNHIKDFLKKADTWF